MKFVCRDIFCWEKKKEDDFLNVQIRLGDFISTSEPVMLKETLR